MQYMHKFRKFINQSGVNCDVTFTRGGGGGGIVVTIYDQEAGGSKKG